MTDQEKWRAELKTSSLEERVLAAEKLCLAGPASVESSVELVEACGDDPAVQEWAVAALEQLGPPTPDAIEPLEALVQSSNSLVAYWAATLLGRLGTIAADCQVTLAGVLSTSQEVSVKERAAWALGKVGATDDMALDALALATTSCNQRLARTAQKAMPHSES